MTTSFIIAIILTTEYTKGRIWLTPEGSMKPVDARYNYTLNKKIEGNGEK